MRYRVEMLVDGVWYIYGTYSDRKKANEVAKMIRDTRSVDVWIQMV